ncbi:PREDICTED: cyclic nucleotide-binding domain-containing protein 2-like [Acropora digitifera]|uniref:cyclic nucleotide-binding domain-containing protein 2-like n=1 Tax=Acropora digitifera TaxID=70779 RepID=UPI000779FCA4|nr:PREDICTED: cyclic nucleotide-binding domain-containing protein 2-like [Acropora digitifera]
MSRSESISKFIKLDGESVTGVDCDGMVFDPNNFKAKREVHLSLEAIHILSLSPGSRTEEQLQTVLKALKTSVAAFGEYPLKMQRRLVSVGWYERFEAKRVIIRQGHKAENFYFILSGTAVVTLLINDAKTKEERDTTVAVLGKGSSFGELALLHHKTRSATVLCKDDVSLLAVSREDFRDIFMSYEDGREPEHIRFLRSVPYLKDLPLQDLTTKHDVCIFHYFRRGVVIVKESKTKWIYVVKSGSCRVLTHLSKKTAKFSRSVIDQVRQKAVLPVIPVDDGDRRRALFTAAGDRVRPTAWSPDLTRAKTEPSFTSQQETDLSLPAIVGESEKFKKTAKNVAIATIVSALPKEGNEKEEQDQEELQRLNTKRTNNTNKTWRKMSPSDDKNGMSDPGQKGEQVVVQIELLKPKDQFGLSMVLFDNPAVKCHLVSNGAECVLIKKSWFLQHANEALLRKLRHQIPPYPSQAKLEQKMQDQANWDSFKSQTLNTLLDTLHL